MKKTKILYIINNLGIGGAEKVLFLLLRELSKRPDLELVLVSLEGTGTLEAEFRKLPIKVKTFHYHLFKTFFSRFDPYFRYSLYRFVKSEKPDVIHGNLIRGEDFAKVLGGILHIPVVVTLHDIMIQPRKYELFLSRYLTRAVGVSQVVVDHLTGSYGLPKSQTGLIPDAIDFDDFKGSQKDFDTEKPVFLFIGRLLGTKGIADALAGLAKLWQEVPGLKFLIYGAKVHDKDYDQWAEMIEKNVWSFAKFMGPTADVPAVLKTGDIFILPSKTEGFGMAPLEAAAAAKPLILTKTGAMTDMVVEGKNGYFVEYGDSEAIYSSAKKILTGNVEKMGEYSREYNKGKFSVQNMAEMYYNVYLSVRKK